MSEINWRAVSNQLRIEGLRLKLIADNLPPSEAEKKSALELQRDLAVMFSSALDVGLPKQP